MGWELYKNLVMVVGRWGFFGFGSGFVGLLVLCLGVGNGDDVVGETLTPTPALRIF